MPSDMARSPLGPNRALPLLAAATALLVLASCKGGGSSTGSAGTGSQGLPVDISAASGRVVLPTGVTIPLSQLTVTTAIAAAAVSADGTFTVPVLGSGPVIVDAEDSSGVTVLMGYADAASSGSPQAGGKGEISATQTAIALLFLGIGAWDISPVNWQAIRDAIAQSPEATQLASVISTRMAADTEALSDGDAQVLSAVSKNASALGPPASSPAPSTVSGPIEAHTLTAATVTVTGSQILVENPGVQSGVEVQVAPDNKGIVFVNSYRRRCTAFIYETEAVDATGKGVLPGGALPKPLPFTTQTLSSAIYNALKGEPPVQIQNTFEIPTANALNGLVGSLVDLNDGTGVAFKPATSGEVTLPEEQGAAKTTYRVVVVGPAPSESNLVSASGLAATSLGTQYAPMWQAAVTSLSYEEFILDFLLPMISTVALGEGDHITLAGLEVSGETVGAIAQFAGFFSGLPDVNTSVANGDFAGAFQGLGQLVADTDAFQEFVLDMGSLLLDQLVVNNPQGLIGPAATLKATIANSLKTMITKYNVPSLVQKLGAANGGEVKAAAEALLVATDITAVVHDAIASFPVVYWDVDVVAASVKLAPQNPTVSSTSPVVNFVTTIPGVADSSAYQFVWTFTGTLGGLFDVNSGQPVSTGVKTSDDQVNFVVASPNPPPGETSTVTVTVYDSSGNLFGQASSTVLSCDTWWTAVINNGNETSWCYASGPVAGSGGLTFGTTNQEFQVLGTSVVSSSTSASLYSINMTFDLVPLGIGNALQFSTTGCDGMGAGTCDSSSSGRQFNGVVWAGGEGSGGPEFMTYSCSAQEREQCNTTHPPQLGSASLTFDWAIQTVSGTFSFTAISTSPSTTAPTVQVSGTFTNAPFGE